MSLSKAPATPLLDGERHLAMFPASLPVFIYRALLIGAITALVFAGLALGLGYWSPVLPMWRFLGIVIGFAALSVFLFDGPSRWMRHSSECWHLTDRRLLFEDARFPEQDFALPLSQIASATPIFSWNLRLKLTDGTAMLMHFVRSPDKIRKRIELAQRHGGAPDA